MENIVEEISGNELRNVLGKPCSIINFFTEWNMSCLMLSPVFEELAEKFRGKINFAKVNMDDNSAIIKKLKVEAIPTFIMFKQGKEIKRLSGNLTSEQLEQHILTSLK